jgi:tape measure domain-containing protein
VVVSDTLITLFEAQGLGAWSAAFGRAEAILGSFGGAVDAAGARTLLFATGAAAGAGLLAAGIAKAVQEASNLEQIRVGFETVFGSAAAADAKIQELQNFAAKTPFNFQQTANLSRQLVAMGIAADDVVPVMTDLGDAVSALGLGQDALARVAFNFGQIKTQGRLTGREMRDFAMNGIPVFDILREKLHLTEDQMRRIGDQGISADVALKALREGLHERFGGAMEKQNKTLAGSWSNLQDSMQRAGAAIGGGFLAPATALVRTMTAVLDIFNALPAPIKSAFGLALGIAVVGMTAASISMVRGVLAATALTAGNVKLAQSYGQVASSANQAAGTAQGKPGGGLFGGGGWKGFAVALGLDFGGQALQDASNKGKGPLAQLGSQLGFIGHRAGQGAEIGSIIPVVGPLIGGLIGAIEGAGETAFRGNKATGFGQSDPHLAEAKKQTDALNKIADSVENKSGGWAGPNFMPVGVQRGLMRQMAKATG